MACVTLISACAAVGILFIKKLSKRAYDHFITIFVAVGVGSLITSSTLHLLPQVILVCGFLYFRLITTSAFRIIQMRWSTEALLIEAK